MSEPPLSDDELRVLRMFARGMLTVLKRDGGAGGGIASDADLDGPKGNPKIKFDPKRWREANPGESFKDRLASDAPAAFLDEYAETLDYFASNPKEGKEKYAKYDRLDAARCRGWAARARQAPPTPSRTNGAPASPAVDDPYADRSDEWGADRM